MPEIPKSSTYFLEALSNISNNLSSNDITLEEFLEITGNNGRLILCMILVTPFLIPISIPGSSIPFGLIIMFIGVSFVFDKTLIPKRILRYKFKKDTALKILKGTISVLNKFEKIFKHRILFLTSDNHTHFLNGVLLIYAAFLLMLPLPVPLTDSLPAYSIFLMSASILERDGYFILVSYALILFTSIYFGLIFILGFEVISFILSHLCINLPKT
ncbi:MAG: exopolysaccharide biosynthesis protein [Methanobacterium sp.]